MAASPAPRSPLRLGGIALLGVGAVAAAVGVFSAATAGEGEGTVARAATASSPAVPTMETVEPSVALPSAALPTPDAGTLSPGATTPLVPVEAGGGTGVAPEPPVVAAPAPEAPAPGVGGGAGAGSAGSGAAGGGPAVAATPLRVYNNSDIPRLAEQAADDFRRAGWRVAEVGNYPDAILPRSTVYYRPGTDEEAAARHFGSAFGMQVAPRTAQAARQGPGVIVVVAREYRAPGR